MASEGQPAAGLKFKIAMIATIVIVGGGAVALIAWVVTKLM